MHFFPAEKDTPSTIALSLEMLRKWKENGITNQEYEYAKNSLINNNGFSFNTSKKRIGNLLVEEMLDLPIGFIKNYADSIGKVSFKSTNEVIKNHVTPEVLQIVVVGTAKTLKSSIAKALNIKSDQIKVIPYNKEM